MKTEVEQLKNRLRQVQHIDAEYKKILHEKERLIQDHNSILSQKLYELSERESELKADLKEFEEAMQAGKSVHQALDSALASLEKAKDWGTFDMLGGGMISTAIKHNHMDDAKQRVHLAQQRMRLFQKELNDISSQLRVEFNVQGLLTFADYFFDGLIVDWVVQGRIKETLQQVDHHRRKIQPLLNDLQIQKSRTEQELQQVQAEKTKQIEQAGPKVFVLEFERRTCIRVSGVRT